MRENPDGSRTYTSEDLAPTGRVDPGPINPPDAYEAHYRELTSPQHGVEKTAMTAHDPGLRRLCSQHELESPPEVNRLRREVAELRAGITSLRAEIAGTWPDALPSFNYQVRQHWIGFCDHLLAPKPAAPKRERGEGEGA